MNFLNQFIQDPIGALEGIWCLWNEYTIIRDFNSTMTMEEREGESSSSFTRDMIQFNNFVQDCFQGFPLLSSGWRIRFQEGCGYHLAQLKLNHTFLWSNLKGNKNIRPFRFMVTWLRHNGFLIHISYHWQDTKGSSWGYFEEKFIFLHRLNKIASRITLHDGTYLKETQ
ncbi:hypothetical protein CR513_55844, partial [Mucuna pruriens]